MFYIVTVTDCTCSISSVSRIVRVLYHHCHGWYVFYIVAVTDSTCSISSLSRIVRVLFVTVTDSTCSISSVSRIVRILYHHCHGWYVFYIVAVTDSTCSVLLVSRKNKTTLIHKFDQHSHCSSHGPHTSLPLGLLLRLFVVVSDFFLLQLSVSSVPL